MPRRPRPSPQFFLETSVQIQRRVGTDRVKREIEETIGGETCVSSFYVFMEYKRVLIKSLVEFWGVVQEEDTVADALYHFSQHMQPRKPKIILSILGRLIAEQDLQNDKTLMLRSIEMMIEASVVAFVGDIVRFIDDRQACPLARASTAEGHERFLKEIACETKCSVNLFWKAERASVQRLAEEGKTAQHQRNKQFALLHENIVEAAGDPQSQKTKAKCAKCGDVIIALELPANLTLLTYDRSFESLCGILGKASIRIPSLAALKRRDAAQASP